MVSSSRLPFFQMISNSSHDFLSQIIRSGENIASVSVENAIFQHDGVKEVAVVPVPCPIRGEEVACVPLSPVFLDSTAELIMPLLSAVVVLHPSSRVSTSPATEESLKALVTSLLPKHCVPAMILFTETELPRNATGKVLKADVKKYAAVEWSKRQAKETKAKL